LIVTVPPHEAGWVDVGVSRDSQISVLSSSFQYVEAVDEDDDNVDDNVVSPVLPDIPKAPDTGSNMVNELGLTQVETGLTSYIVIICLAYAALIGRMMYRNRTHFRKNYFTIK
jgi:hypothetical protein